MKCKLKHELLPIKNSIEKLANPKYSMKKKKSYFIKTTSRRRSFHSTCFICYSCINIYDN